MTLIGSKAIKHWFPDFKREPKDADYAVAVLPETKTRGIDCLLLPDIVDLGHEVLPPNELLTLKASHLFWELAWSKHMYDVQWLLSKGCQIDRVLFHKLHKYHCEFHGEKHRSNLDQSAKDFFNNALKKYDHDYLHTLLNPEPTFKKVLKEGAEVAVDESKYHTLSHQEKLDLVREEIYVMAYERLAGRSYREAYSWMLKKFIISHAPIYEALFIIENHKELYKPLINYKQKLDYELSRDYQ